MTGLILNISKSPETAYNHSKFHESIVNKVAKIKGGVFLWQRELKLDMTGNLFLPTKILAGLALGFPKLPESILSLIP